MSAATLPGLEKKSYDYVCEDEKTFVNVVMKSRMMWKVSGSD